MMEMIKNKGMILFMVLMLGITFIATPTNKLDENNTNEEYVYNNIK